ncbi:tRNA (guanine-N(1)-)-methyltransferase [bacterium]|nr:MAG: tRNA (guanine-N(1)-)-methyltransferase [bacterium]
MKKISIITPTPEIITSVMQNSIVVKAKNNNIVDFEIINLRDYSDKKYKKVDDNPYGGGAGMVMMAEPLFKAIDDILKKMNPDNNFKIIYPNPQGKTWDHSKALSFSSSDENLIFICGHYKGIDERVVEKYVTDEYSLGDYVISNGELSTLVIIDSIVRLMPGVLNHISSAQTDSFYNNLLDAPYYTNPRELDGMKVPDVLLSGDHKKIKSWKNKNRKARTMINRPDLWNRYINENKSEIRNE